MRPAHEFVPSVHGLPFPNCWPAGAPVLEIATPFGTIPIGDASGGVCGGMVFAAADWFLAGQPVPTTATPEAFRYFCKRLLDSWALPFGALKYFDWQRRPVASKTFAGVTLLDGTRRLTLTDEWPRLKARLDCGLLAPLGLVQAGGWHPRRMGQHHQVLAHAYVQSGDEVSISIYDPNHPSQDDCVIRFHITNCDSDELMSHRCQGPCIRGFFNVDYVALGT